MIEKEKYCVVDAGNTHIKIVDFVGKTIVNQYRVALKEKKELRTILTERQKVKSVFSSVLNAGDAAEIQSYLLPNIVLNSASKFPISLAGYQTPETLGADRIANAVAANYYSKTSVSLVVDLGTCIKFDLVVNGVYQGGSISPGYGMRLQAMHEFTGALPLLEMEKIDYLIGKSTKQCMLSGVMKGVQAEIEQFMDTYKQKFPTLTIFLTGGDHKMFEKAVKNTIFADENLTVKGLLLILQHNV